MLWKVIDTGTHSAEDNMRLDRELLHSLTGEHPCILHLYEWERPSITYGYFIDPKQSLHIEHIRERQIACVRRPTGGGIVFHLWDMAFSALIPDRYAYKTTLDNYAMMHRAVLAAIQEWLQREGLSLSAEDLSDCENTCTSFCMANPSRYDLMFRGKKIAGAAQRRCAKGILHQGTIALMLPPQEELTSLLLPATPALEAIYRYTYPLIPGDVHPERLATVKQELRHLLPKHLENIPIGGEI